VKEDALEMKEMENLDHLDDSEEEDTIQEQDKQISPDRLDNQDTKILEEEYFALEEGHKEFDPTFQIPVFKLVEAWEQFCFNKERRRRMKGDKASSNGIRAIASKKPENKYSKKITMKYPIHSQATSSMGFNQKLQMGFLSRVLHDAENKSIETDNLDDIDMSDFEIPQEDRQVLDYYLKKFLVFKNDTVVPSIDITLMIKALPNRTNEYSVLLNEMFNFRVFQESLIAFQNQEMVLAFEYFDLKNSERVFEVKHTIDR